MLSGADARSRRVIWSMLGLIAVVVPLWLWLSPVDFELASLRNIGLAFGFLGYVAAMLWIGDRALVRRSGRGAEIGRWMTDRGLTLLAAWLLLALFTAFSATFSYLAVTPALPLWDARFAAMDRALGFDWLGFVGWVNQRPWLGQALTWSYHSLYYQVEIVMLVLVLVGQRRELWQFLALFMVTLVPVIALSILLPAEGAYLFHAPDKSITANLNPEAGRWYYADFVALRAGTLHKIDLRTIQGIVQFPSFHTALGIIIPFALRNVRWAFWPAVGLNALLIVSTTTEGGHFLADVIGGAAITVAAIMLVAQPEMRRFKSWATRLQSAKPAALEPRA